MGILSLHKTPSPASLHALPFPSSSKSPFPANNRPSHPASLFSSVMAASPTRLPWVVSSLSSCSSSSFRSSIRLRSWVKGGSFSAPAELTWKTAITLPPPINALPIARGYSISPLEISLEEVIDALINRVDLSEKEAEACLNLLLTEANEVLISAFLVLLRAKGETFQEIAGLARAMINYAVKVEGIPGAVDIVGTGGDGSNTVNISTGASILAAAAGLKVAKQGNRSSSSACGSADVLEALGVNLELGPGDVKRCVKEAGIGFMMASIYNPALEIVRPVRKKLKIKTVFNILGPMLNPAQVPYAVVGVYNEDLAYENSIYCNIASTNI